MIEAYVIGVSLELNDAITGQLDGVYQQTEQLADSVDSINTALASTGELVAGVTGSLHAMITAFTQAAEAARGMQDAAATAGGGGRPPVYGGGPTGPGGEPPGGIGAGEPPPTPQLPGTPGVPALIPGHPYYSGDDGNTFNRSGYVPNWTPGRGGDPATDEPFNAPPGGPVPLYPGRRPGGGGGGGGPHIGLSDLFFGKAVLDAAGHIIDQGFGSVADPDQQITEMELRDKHFSPADGAKVMAAAKQIVNQNPGMSLIGALKIIQNGYVQTHNVDTSIAMAGPLAADAMRLHNAGRDDAVDGIWDLQRSAELAGTLNSKNKDGSINIDPFMNWIDNATQILQADQNIDTNDIWLATQQNDLGAMSASGQGQAEQDIVAGLLGGYKSGTGSAALEREMIGGKMSTGTAKVLEKLGLIDASGATKTGQYYTLKPGALKDEKLFASNPVEWFQKDFQPAVDRLSPGDRDALFHDIIAGTGTASGAREAVVDVMQEALIARMLWFAYHDEPNKQQSQAIIDKNPATAAAYAGSELGVFENTYLTGATSPGVDFLDWSAHELNNLSTHPLATIANNIKASASNIYDTINYPATVGEQVSGTIAEDFKNFLTTLLTKIFGDMVSAIMSQGATPATAIYTKDVPAGPTVPQASKPTNRNTALSPPLPGRVNRTP